MIVIHIDNGSQDASALSIIYEGIDGITVYRNPRKTRIRRILRTTGDETVMLLGHGTQHGLLNERFDGFAVGENEVEWLRNRTVIGIFCYASEFADRYGLHGFFTSMFISNMTEAIAEQLYNRTTEDMICEQERLFCDRVHELIENDCPLQLWPERLQNQADLSIPFVRFNYEALTYYE